MVEVFAYARSYPDKAWPALGVMVAATSVGGKVTATLFDGSEKEKLGYQLPPDISAMLLMGCQEARKVGEDLILVTDSGQMARDENYIRKLDWFKDISRGFAVLFRTAEPKLDEGVSDLLEKACEERYAEFFASNPQFYHQHRRLFATDKQKETLKKFRLPFKDYVSKNEASSLIGAEIARFMKNKPNTVSVYSAHGRFYCFVISERFRTEKFFRFINAFEIDPEHYSHIRSAILPVEASYRRKYGIYSLQDNEFLGRNEGAIELMDCCKKYLKEKIVPMAALMAA